MPTDAVWRWLTSGDTGISSKTIWYVMTGEKPDNEWWPSIPHDVYDFGRCVRLIDRFPEWAHRLPEVAQRYPKWSPLVERWDELVRLYRADSEWRGECNRAILMIDDPSGRLAETLLAPPMLHAEDEDEDEECTCCECPVHS